MKIGFWEVGHVEFMAAKSTEKVECRCVCKRVKLAEKRVLVTGQSRSCGCKKSALFRKTIFQQPFEQRSERGRLAQAQRKANGTSSRKRTERAITAAERALAARTAEMLKARAA